MSEVELEKSLQHQEDILDEIECIEKTLLKRRAELREADRLLAEAESELSCTKEKVCPVGRELRGVTQLATSAGRHISACCQLGQLGSRPGSAG